MQTTWTETESGITAQINGLNVVIVENAFGDNKASFFASNTSGNMLAKLKGFTDLHAAKIAAEVWCLNRSELVVGDVLYSINHKTKRLGSKVEIKTIKGNKANDAFYLRINNNIAQSINGKFWALETPEIKSRFDAEFGGK